MFIRVERERHSVARDVATEAVHRGNRALIRIESGKDTAARIVDVGHQRTPGPTPLAPVRVRAVQLDQFPHVGLPSPPCPVRLLPPCGLADPARPQPLPPGLGTERDPMPLGQLLRRKGRPTVPLVLPIQSRSTCTFSAGRCRRFEGLPRLRCTSPASPSARTRWLSRRTDASCPPAPRWPPAAAGPCSSLAGSHAPASTPSHSYAPCPLRPYGPPSEGSQSTQEDISTLAEAAILMLGLHVATMC